MDSEKVREYEEFLWLIAQNLHRGLSKSFQKVQAAAIRELLEENNYVPPL